MKNCDGSLTGYRFTETDTDAMKRSWFRLTILPPENLRDLLFSPCQIQPESAGDNEYFPQPDLVTGLYPATVETSREPAGLPHPAVFTGRQNLISQSGDHLPQAADDFHLYMSGVG